MSRVLFSLVLVSATACLLGGALSAVLQDGRRFPMGIQLGSDVNCTSAEDDGLLRLNGEQVEMCQDLQWVSVSANETRQLNTELSSLRGRVDQLEQEVSTCSSQNSSGSGSSTCNLGHLEALTAIQMCNLHGVYNAIERQCDCDCDARLGCWNSTDFCTTCASGWVGQYCLGDVEAPEISIVGGDVVTHEAGDPYVDAGATAFDNKDLDVTGEIIVQNNVVFDTVGTYTVEYSVTDNGGNSASATRTVHVVDTTAPVITLIGPGILTVEAGDAFVEPGLTATDNAVGTLDVTTNLESFSLRTVGQHTLVYSLVDDAANHAINKERTLVVVDTTPPVLSLLGKNPTYHGLGITFVDSGAEATDNSDGNVEINSVSNVNVNVLGNYSVVYSAVDPSGNEAIEVTREIIVTDAASCDMYQLESEDPLEDGVYTVVRNGAAKETYCHFADGRGYDLVMNLDTSDTVSRNYDDTSFWLSTSSIGSVSSSSLNAEFKGSSWSELDYVQEILIMYHDGAGTVIGEAVYSVLCSYSGQGLTMSSLMNSGNDVVITSVKRTPSIDLGLHADSVDIFMERGEALIFNSQSAYSAVTNRNRILTTYRTAPFTGHVTGGIGGFHYHSGSNGWGMKYELAPVEPYCPQNDAYGVSSSPGGNYVSAGYNSYNLQPSCAGSLVWKDISAAIFVLGGEPITPLPEPLRANLFYSCDMYVAENPFAVTGPVTFANGQSSYCYFENGVGYDLLFNLDTDDSSVRHYHDENFWFGNSFVGSISANTLTEEFLGNAYVDGHGWSEVMMMVHNEGSTVFGKAYYDAACSASRSFADLIGSGATATITGTKKNAHASLGLSDSPSIDIFFEESAALVVNRGSAYGASRNLNRLATAETGPSSGHMYGGIGGDHYHSGSNGWGFYYEYLNKEPYCPMNNLYGSGSGNVVCGIANSCPTQSSCASSSVTKPYDVAVFARIPAPTSSSACSAC